MFATIKRKVYEQILADGRAQGREEGRSEVRAEVRETQQRWEEWNRRRMQAEARGERFEEPPPGE